MVVEGPAGVAATPKPVLPSDLYVLEAFGEPARWPFNILALGSA